MSPHHKLFMDTMLANENDTNLKKVFINYKDIGFDDAQYDANLCYQAIKEIKASIQDYQTRHTDDYESKLEKLKFPLAGYYPSNQLSLSLSKRNGNVFVLGISGNFFPFLNDDCWPWLSAPELHKVLQGLGPNVVIPSAKEITFWQRLEAVRYKAQEHYNHACDATMKQPERDTHMRAHVAASSLHQSIQTAYVKFFCNKNKDNYEHFALTSTLAIIKAKQSELQNHRGWKAVMANLVFLIPGLNVVIAGIRALNLLVFHGNFWFKPDTDSIQRVNELEEAKMIIQDNSKLSRE